MARVGGLVRDAWTGAFVEDVAVRFRAVSGALAGRTYGGSPDAFGEGSNWVTGADGRFPTNVWLSPVDWDLDLVKSGYSNLVVSGAVAGVSDGDELDLGARELTPIDVDGDRVADAWETLWLGGTNSAAGEDDDRDGHSNRSEYLCGTDPDDAASALRFGVCERAAAGTGAAFRVSWPVSPGREYRVMSRDNLMTGAWEHVFGPWEAGAGDAEKAWDDTNAPARPERFYRVDVLVP
jgi:hypothetical protein